MLNLAFLFLLQCLSTINIIIIVSVMEWPNELVLDFLTFYEIEAVIWNPALPNHKNRNEVYDAWKRIEEKMEKKFTVTELKKKKDSLMASYRTWLKKVKDTIKSGAGTEDIYKPNWFAYEMMDRFLKDKNVPRETLTSEVIDLYLSIHINDTRAQIFNCSHFAMEFFHCS